MSIHQRVNLAILIVVMIKNGKEMKGSGNIISQVAVVGLNVKCEHLKTGIKIVNQITYCNLKCESAKLKNIPVVSTLKLRITSKCLYPRMMIILIMNSQERERSMRFTF